MTVSRSTYRVTPLRNFVMWSADCTGRPHGVRVHNAERLERERATPGRMVNEIYSRLSDSELILLRYMAQDKADEMVVAEVEAELVRRADRSHRHAVR